MLVVSNNGFNRHFPLVTVLPLTTAEGKQRRVYGFEVLLPAGAAGNRVDSIVMPHQVRTIALSRITRILGALRSPELRESIEDRMLDHLGIGFEDDPAT